MPEKCFGPDCRFVIDANTLSRYSPEDAALMIQYYCGKCSRKSYPTKP